MATASKRAKNTPRKSGGKKTAAKKAAKKSSSNAAPKKAVPKKVAQQKSASKKAAVKKAKPEKKVSNKKAAKQPIVKTTAATQRANNESKAPPKRDVSPDAQKKLATRHIWELVEAKKRSATKTPSWQTIAHHDHPAPRGGQEHGGDQSSAASTHIEMPGHRDRGTG